MLDLQRLHKLGSYLMVASAFAALWTGGAFGPLVGGLFAIAGVASWFFEPPRFNLSQYTGAWAALTVAFVASCVGLLVFTEQRFVEVGVYLVLYLTGVKLYQRARLVDYQQLFALSFLLIAAATAFNEDITFGAFFVVYVVCGVVTFAMHHLRVELEETEAGGTRQSPFGWQYLQVLVGLSLLTFVSSVVFFFAFPRLGFGLFVSQARQGAQTVGFSEEVNLGTHGTIKDDQTIVMRVSFPKGPPDNLASLHWRGVSFDHYDGRKWSDQLREEHRLFPGTHDRYHIPRLPGRRLAIANTEQHIYLEPIGSSVIFGLHEMTDVQLATKDQSLSFMQRHRVSHSASDAVRHYTRKRPRELYRAPLVGYSYIAYSNIDKPAPDELRSVSAEDSVGGLSNGMLSRYTNTPIHDEAIAALAQRVTQNSDTNYDKVLAVYTYLQDNYTYTTDLPDPGERPPLDFFLFESKRGHCEFFATAMAIMLRTVGIPTRNVNGFLGGDWNGFDDYLAVRNADAHSWVEVYFGPKHGWVEFDPTPPAANMTGVSESWFAPVSRFWDAMRFTWLKYVIEYDLSTQLDLLREAWSSMDTEASEEDSSPAAFQRKLRDTFWDSRKNALPAGLVLLLAGLAWFGIRIRQTPPSWLDGAVALAAIGGSLAIVFVLWKPDATTASFVFAVVVPLSACALAVRRRLRKPRPARVSTIGIAKPYSALRDALYAHALPPLPTEGPEKLLARVEGSDLAQRGLIAALIRRYMSVRFGGKKFDRHELRDFERSVRKVNTNLRRSAKSKR